MLAKLMKFLPLLFLLAVLGLGRAFASISSELWCAQNIRQIDSVVHNWALENGIATTNSISFQDTNIIASFRRGGFPVCPNGGQYVPGATLDAETRCSIHGTVEQARAGHERRVAESIRVRRQKEKLLLISGCAVVIAIFTGYYFIRKRIVRRFSN
jgi:hypothetical protein